MEAVVVLPSLALAFSGKVKSVKFDNVYVERERTVKDLSVANSCLFW